MRSFGFWRLGPGRVRGRALLGFLAWRTWVLFAPWTLVNTRSLPSKSPYTCIVYGWLSIFLLPGTADAV